MRLRDLRNLGPASERMLKAAGIETPRQLDRVGAAEAYRRVQRGGGDAHRNLLWSLEGALLDVDWRDVPRDRKEALEREVSDKGQTNPAGNGADPPRSKDVEMPEELDEEMLALAHRVFDLARSGERDELAALVSAGVPANLTNDKGDTLLILAAYHDHPPTVQMLLEHGAETARVNDRGQTALAAAVFRRSVDGVGALLAGGADPELGSPSARDVARFFELSEMLALLDVSADPSSPSG